MSNYYDAKKDTKLYFEDILKSISLPMGIP